MLKQFEKATIQGHLTGAYLDYQTGVEVIPILDGGPLLTLLGSMVWWQIALRYIIKGTDISWRSRSQPRAFAENSHTAKSLWKDLIWDVCVSVTGAWPLQSTQRHRLAANSMSCFWWCKHKLRVSNWFLGRYLGRHLRKSFAGGDECDGSVTQVCRCCERFCCDDIQLINT